MSLPGFPFLKVPSMIDPIVNAQETIAQDFLLLCQEREISALDTQ